MPSVDDVLTQLGAIAVALLCGWRPPQRLGGVLLVPPLLSVSILAWSAGNPFNGVVFALVAALFLLAALKRPCAPARVAPAASFFPGLALFAFGWAYPHFVAAPSFLPYLYATPVGLIPCPTLAIVIGLVLMLDGLGSRSAFFVLGAAGLFYGAFGVFRLGVAVDWTLLLGASVAVARGFASRPAVPAGRAQ